MGIVTAFADQPEHTPSGLSPLRYIMKEHQLRTVRIYPRLQEDIKKSIERRREEVVEHSQPHTSEPMANVHHAIIKCMNTTLSELRRSNTTVRFTFTSPSSLMGHYSLTSTTTALKTPTISALLTCNNSMRCGLAQGQTQIQATCHLATLRRL